MGFPLVTGICITRNRREWLPKALACFQQQTYAAKELWIIADGQDVRDLVPANERIHLAHLARALEIGAKRNYGGDLAIGDLVAHWDDDDYSAPDRLTDQVSRLQASGKAVTGYTHLAFSDGKRWVRYRDEHYVFGTSLLYRRDWWEQHPFPRVPSGEDNAFVQEARQAEQLVYVPAGDRMWASVHPGNTSDRKLDLPCWEEVSEFGLAVSAAKNRNHSNAGKA